MLHHCPIQATKCFAYADVASSVAASFATNQQTAANTVFNFGSGRVDATISQEGQAKADATATTAKGGNAAVDQGASGSSVGGLTNKTLLIGGAILGTVAAVILIHHHK